MKRINDFANKQQSSYKGLIKELSQIILNREPNLNIIISNVMGADMLCLSPTKSDNDYRYGFSIHNKHMSFHSMPMYCKPEINKTYSKLFSKTKFQKSCINIKDNSEIDLVLFEKFIEECSKVKYP